MLIGEETNRGSHKRSIRGNQSVSLSLFSRPHKASIHLTFKCKICVVVAQILHWLHIVSYILYYTFTISWDFTIQIFPTISFHNLTNIVANILVKLPGFKFSLSDVFLFLSGTSNPTNLSIKKMVANPPHPPPQRQPRLRPLSPRMTPCPPRLRRRHLRMTRMRGQDRDIRPNLQPHRQEARTISSRTWTLTLTTWGRAAAARRTSRTSSPCSTPRSRARRSRTPSSPRRRRLERRTAFLTTRPPRASAPPPTVPRQPPPLSASRRKERRWK